MDVLFGLVAVVAPGHQLLAHLRVHLQIDHGIRLRDAHQAVFKVKQPLQVFIPLPLRQLAALVDGVGGGVAVGDDDAAVPVEFAPVPLEGGEPVHREEAGGGIGVHILRVMAEFTVQVHFHQRRGVGGVVREGDFPDGVSLPGQIIRQKLRLGSFSAAVQPFDDNEFSV